jgi:hypothetical protein
MYSSIEEISPINLLGEPIKFDNYNYFPTKAKAKKQLIQELTNRMNHLKEAIKYIKESY